MEIEQEGRVAHPMDCAGFEKQAGLAGAITVGEEDQAFCLFTRNVPGLQLVSLRSPEPVSLKRKSQALGIDRVLRARQANAEK